MPIASSGRDDRLTEAPRLSDCRTVRNVTAPAGASPAETAMPLPSGKEGCVMHAGERAETFDRRPDEVPAARRFIRAVLAGHPLREDAELLCCELVTNSVLHAADAARVTVTVSVYGSVVHVEVTDDGIAGVPHWRDIGDDSEGGRGFRLVNELAARWGFLREKAKARSSCWFELGSEEAA